MSKLSALCSAEGFDDPLEMIEDYMDEGGIPGICMNKGCDATYNYEHDCREGWCSVCKTNSVTSVMMLMGII